MSDPFADAQVAPTTAADPFTSAHEMDDPFATSSDFKGGDFTPSPTLEGLKGRLIVMIPRSLDPNAKDPNDPSGQKTREVFTVDLTVLDGGELRYHYNSKGNPEATDPKDREDTVKEWVVDNIAPDSPFTVRRFWVPQAGVIGKLKQAHANGRPYLGVPAMVPVKADRDKGKTGEQVEREVEAWITRGRQGLRPRYSWTLADPSPEQRAAALAWWKREAANIEPITPVTYTRG
jgi:hypothetical protein